MGAGPWVWLRVVRWLRVVGVGDGAFWDGLSVYFPCWDDTGLIRASSGEERWFREVASSYTTS